MLKKKRRKMSRNVSMFLSDFSRFGELNLVRAAFEIRRASAKVIASAKSRNVTLACGSRAVLLVTSTTTTMTLYMSASL